MSNVQVNTLIYHFRAYLQINRVFQKFHRFKNVLASNSIKCYCSWIIVVLLNSRCLHGSRLHCFTICKEQTCIPTNSNIQPHVKRAVYILTESEMFPNMCVTMHVSYNCTSKSSISKYNTQAILSRLIATSGYFWHIIKHHQKNP